MSGRNMTLGCFPFKKKGNQFYHKGRRVPFTSFSVIGISLEANVGMRLELLVAVSLFHHFLLLKKFFVLL